VRGLLGDGLDVHAALGAGNQNRATGGAVHEDGEVELAGDVQGLGHHHCLDGHTLRGGLLGDQVVAEHLLRDVTDNRGAGFEGKRERRMFRSNNKEITKKERRTPWSSELLP